MRGWMCRPRRIVEGSHGSKPYGADGWHCASNANEIRKGAGNPVIRYPSLQMQACSATVHVDGQQGGVYVGGIFHVVQSQLPLQKSDNVYKGEQYRFLVYLPRVRTVKVRKSLQLFVLLRTNSLVTKPSIARPSAPRHPQSLALPRSRPFHPSLRSRSGGPHSPPLSYPVLQPPILPIAS